MLLITYLLYAGDRLYDLSKLISQQFSYFSRIKVLRGLDYGKIHHQDSLLRDSMTSSV